MNDTILITGSTGFLGGATVVQALRSGLGSRLLLLARGKDSVDALERIRANLRLLGATSEEAAEIGVPQLLFGDLGTLDTVSADPRLQQVSVCVHSAALATFSNHPSLEKVNVDGTLALGRLLYRRPAFRRFLYIGTAMACGVGASDDGTVTEQLALRPEADHLVPYTRSKALAERMLQAKFPGLPVVMVRPSIVVGHTTLGCAPSQSIFWVFLVAQLLGAFTIALDDRIDVVPVDWCAASIMALALKPELAHDVYHLSAGMASSVSFREVDVALAAARGVTPVGAAYRQTDVRGLADLMPRMREVIPGCNDRLLLRALKLYGGFAKLSYVFRNDNLLAEGIPPSPRLSDYLARCYDSARDIPVATQMEWDFK
ncbi:NAD-dependent epimerase/dehydratase family protein [Oxalobacteraceae bacterium OM1]|nr:NAD-dependent epimerase/dehydratase family protein [Oxalobacteraceae bacterium OM1]